MDDLFLGEDSPIFTGTSIDGDFSEALRIAIAQAKNELRTDLVRWRLADISGIYGGFVNQADLTVAIFVKAGLASSAKDFAAAASLPSQVIILQNELPGGESLTYAETFLSTRTDGGSAVGRRIKFNGQNISPINKLPINQQGSVDISGDNRKYRSVRISYTAEGSNQVSSRLFVTNGNRNGSLHSILQAIFRVKTIDASLVQVQIDGQV